MDENVSFLNKVFERLMKIFISRSPYTLSQLAASTKHSHVASS